jgi:hypothetical protein
LFYKAKITARTSTNRPESTYQHRKTSKRRPLGGGKDDFSGCPAGFADPVRGGTEL